MTPLISFANSPDADPSMIQVGTFGEISADRFNFDGNERL